MTYRESHELLKEMGPVFEEKDHRHHYFQVVHDIRYDHLFFHSAFRHDINETYSLATRKFYDRCCSVFHIHDPLGWWVSPTDFTLSQDIKVLKRHRKAMEKEDSLQVLGKDSINQVLIEKFSQSKSAKLLE